MAIGNVIEMCSVIQKIVKVEFKEIDENLPKLEVSHYQLLRILTVLNNHPLLQFKRLLDIAVVDKVHDGKSWIVSYLVMSSVYLLRLNMSTKIKCSEKLPSISTLYLSALGLEKNIKSLYGVDIVFK